LMEQFWGLSESCFERIQNTRTFGIAPCETREWVDMHNSQDR
jgi:hypothetical protein